MAYTTINKSSDYFNTKLYTGNASTNAITGVGFAPDFVWIKERSSTSSHVLGNTVRGANKRLQSDTDSAEGTLSNIFTSFDSDGFTNGADNGVNQNGETYASWNWKASGSGSANTDGSITTTVSANTTAGFSIVQFTSGSSSLSTYGHGLGVAPSMIIARPVDTTSGWFVYSKDLGNSSYLRLNETDAVATGSNLWANTSPTNANFYLRDISFGTNKNSIAYCFAEKTGYSKFGSYKGNGNANGTFVYTGFKPAFILMKRSDTANSYDNWYIFDNKRDGFNPNNKKIAPNISDAESSDTGLFDLLSNGFKLRTTNSNNNGSGGNFIYMAFAEAPLVGTNNVPCTAR